MQPQRNFDTGIVAPTDNLALKKAGPGQRRRLPLRFVAALAVTVVLLASFAALVALPLKGAVVLAASPCPAVNDWCTTMTVADAEGDGLLHGYEFDKFGSIVDDTIQPGGENINVWTVHTFAHPAPQLPDYIYFGSNPRVRRGTQVTWEQVDEAARKELQPFPGERTLVVRGPAGQGRLDRRGSFALNVDRLRLGKLPRPSF